jgi:hypothetical protein
MSNLIKITNLSPELYREMKTQALQLRTVKDCLSVKTPTIASVRRTFGEEKLKSYIALYLIDLNKSLNLKRFLSDEQIYECSELIVYEFVNLTLADITFVFKRAKMGHYGELYESLSLDKIIRWFSEYYDERLSVAESMSALEHDKIKYSESRSKRISQETTEKDHDFEKFKLNYIINSEKK